jgi:hypothetical protein
MILQIYNNLIILIHEIIFIKFFSNYIKMGNKVPNHQGRYSAGNSPYMNKTDDKSPQNIFQKLFSPTKIKTKGTPKEGLYAEDKIFENFDSKYRIFQKFKFRYCDIWFSFRYRPRRERVLFKLSFL